MKRALEIAIISDVHLGTYGCHAKELTQYLRSIQPRTLIINGDFIDASQFKRKHFSAEHLEVINEVLRMATRGTKVYYVIGNHEDALRRFSNFSTHNIKLRNKLLLRLNGKSYWIFHGDVFDASTKISPWLAQFGTRGYQCLIRLNRLINQLRRRLGQPRMSMAAKVKNNVQRAVQYIREFEEVAIGLALKNGYDYVICGHIHQAGIKAVDRSEGRVTYMNAGDWVESLTALEYNFGRWSIHEYRASDFISVNPRLVVKAKPPKAKVELPQRRTEDIINLMVGGNDS